MNREAIPSDARNNDAADRSGKRSAPGTSPFVRIALFVAVLCNSLNAGSPRTPNAAIQWNRVALEGVRASHLGAPMVSRALAIIHTCMYDAWAAYDDRAIGTELKGALRRPAAERTMANKEEAISYAAYRALVDVMPAGSGSVYAQQLKELGYNPEARVPGVTI